MTIETLQQKFDEFNSLMFGNKIKPCVIKFVKIYELGRYYPMENEIWISSRIIREFDAFMNTLIHEMVHAYINQQNLAKNEKSHGPTFQALARRINVAYPQYLISTSSQTKPDVEYYKNKTHGKQIHCCLVTFKTNDKKILFVFDPKHENLLTNPLNFGLADKPKTECFISTNPYFDSFVTCRKRISGQYVKQELLDTLGLTKYRDSENNNIEFFL